MGGTSGRWPPPAIVVTAIALVAAVAGTAVAANPDANTAAKKVTKKFVKKKAKKEAKKYFNNNIGDASVASAQSAETANSANSANTANSANPIAFARVGPTGQVTASQSKNVTAANLNSPSVGLYCFGGLGFAFKGAEATIDHATATFPTSTGINFATGDPLAECPSGFSQAVVRTNDPFQDVYQDSGFYIQFFN